MMDTTKLILDLRSAIARYPGNPNFRPESDCDDECAEYIARNLLLYENESMMRNIMYLMLGIVTKQWSDQASEFVSYRLVDLLAFDDPESDNQLLTNALYDKFNRLINNESQLILQWLLWRGENLPTNIWDVTWKLAVQNWGAYSQRGDNGNEQSE